MSTDEWLKDQCSRLTYGECQSRLCLLRGGWKGGEPVDYSVATCHAHECLLELERLRGAEITFGQAPAT